MTQSPNLAPQEHVYRIETDGAINYTMTREAFNKIKDK
jgi:hypothetical protein